MITIKACPNCNGWRFGEFQIVSSGHLTVKNELGERVPIELLTRYHRCLDCNLVFQNPRLSDKDLSKYYAHGYYRETVNQPPGGMDKREEDRAKIDSEIIKKYIDNVKAHLDIGCGRGYLLEKVGSETKIGIDLDVDFIKFKKIKVFGKLDQVSPKKFDLVTSIHMLEHVPFPLNYLKDIARFVKKNGYFVVEVPSLKSQGGPLGFAHLSYFEPDVLRLMCRQVGLTVIVTEFTPHLLLICRLVSGQLRAE